jgi:hypothetical protein
MNRFTEKCFDVQLKKETERHIIWDIELKKSYQMNVKSSSGLLYCPEDMNVLWF